MLIKSCSSPCIHSYLAYYSFFNDMWTFRCTTRMQHMETLQVFSVWLLTECFFFVGSQYAVIIDVDSMSWLLTPIVHECALQSMLLLCGQCIVCRSLIHRFLDGIASSVGCVRCIVCQWQLIVRWWLLHCLMVAIASFVGGQCMVRWWPLLPLLVAIALSDGDPCYVCSLTIGTLTYWSCSV